MYIHEFDFEGLTDEQVRESREKHGSNVLTHKSENRLLLTLWNLVKDPMVILLLVAAAIYLIGGEIGDALFLAAAILIISGISIFQEERSRDALMKLKELTQPHCKVVRNGEILEIDNKDVVVGDFIIVEEGRRITADAIIRHSNDFTVDESILTGESMAVPKDPSSKANTIYSGTTVASGMAIAEVTAVGNATKLGRIGKDMAEIKPEKTPLEKQINVFVRNMAAVGGVVFLIVWVMNYLSSRDVLDSLLKSLTLAMSILPEEIPVAFAAFMAIGAYRLLKADVVVKDMKTVETLGAATVICADKTGTITENRMSLVKVFALESGRLAAPDDLNEAEKFVVETAMWASETMPFNGMEISLHEVYGNTADTDRRPGFRMVHEYPLGGTPPLMTHVFESEEGERIIATKGAVEALLNAADPTTEEREEINRAVHALTVRGYRVLGVGDCNLVGDDFPEDQHQLPFRFLGIVAFYDPPKENINEVLNHLYDAGIKVKIITGDNAETTAAIAEQIEFRGADRSLSGEELMHMPEEVLREEVNHVNIFTRMFPEAKLRIINALKGTGQIVAMTGDGVNDGPALRAAHIGVAMGRRGTEIAKQAASLIIRDDDLNGLVQALAMGRRIHANLKKAIQYILSIHIPIVLMVFIPLALGWVYPNIFSPVHVIFLELIMGPTCSIVFENEPLEKHAMKRKPRRATTSFFSRGELVTSAIQGLAITGGTLAAYGIAVSNGMDESKTRTMVFTVLIVANVFLTLVNRSFHYSIFTTIRYRNVLVPVIIGVTLVLTLALLYVPTLNDFFEFSTLTGSELLLCFVLGALSVLWYEPVKFFKRRRYGRQYPAMQD